MIAVDVNQKYSNFLAEEQFRISFPTEQQLLIQSRDELGAIYGLLYLSKEFLGIQPFWFWHDQVIQPCIQHFYSITALSISYSAD